LAKAGVVGGLLSRAPWPVGRILKPMRVLAPSVAQAVARATGIGSEIPFDGDFSIGYTSRLLYRRLFSIWHVMGAD